MASDADRLRAGRLYVESEVCPSDSAISRACGIDRQTVKRWREASSWDIQRAEFWHRCHTDATVAAIAATEGERKATAILSRAEGLGLLSGIAWDEKQKGTTRVMAITRISEIDGWATTTDVQGIEQDNQQTRFVIRRAADG